MGENRVKCITLKSLFSKEVINTVTGERLGYIDDGEIDMECGEIKCFFITSHCGNVFSKKKEIRKFSFEDITKIGSDIILIRSCSNIQRNKGEIVKKQL